jgi:hypothetical protein
VDVFHPTPAKSAATAPTASPAGSSTPTTTKRASSSATPTSSAPTTPTSAQDHAQGRDQRGSLGHAQQRHLAPVRQARKSGRIAVKVINHLGDEVMKVFGTFFEGLRFLGPFRTPPERRYAFGGFGARDTGPTGQHAVDLLITEALLRPKGERSLIHEVSRWLKLLGLARAIEIHDLAKRANLFEVSLSKAGLARRANFADVGFGISQILPVIIQGLLTPRRGVFVVQQPELHLHPDAQAALVDFFLHLANTGVRSLVETHSEYFLVRLRRRLAEQAKRGSREKDREADAADHPSARDGVAILLARERGSEGHKMEELLLGESFQFENLPRDFMSSSIDDRLALLSALSR